MLSCVFSVTICTQVRLWDVQRRSCIRFGNGHLGAISLLPSQRKRTFLLVAAGLLFSFSDVCLPKVGLKLVF
jgi:hypothetical protein